MKNDRNFWETCRAKIANIVHIVQFGNPRWLHGHHLENQFFASSPEPSGWFCVLGVGTMATILKIYFSLLLLNLGGGRVCYVMDGQDAPRVTSNLIKLQVG